MTTPDGGVRPKSFFRVFGSLRLAVILIILIALAAALGTLIPQNPPEGAVEERYGGLAPVVQRLQLTNVYRSPWFLLLVGLFALNLIACSLPRSAAAVRRVVRPREGLDAGRLSGFRRREAFASTLPFEDAQAAVRKTLAAKGWKVYETSGLDEALLRAGKRTVGHFGSGLVHLGLLVITAGGLATGLAGFRERLVLSIGETAAVSGRDMAIRLDDFMTEYHPEGGVKAWKSAVTVLEGGAPAASAVIRVNHPLTHGGITFYQESTGLDWQNAEIEILAGKTDDAERERLRLREGATAELADGTSFGIRHVVPDFFINDRGEIATRTWEPRNPAVLVEGKTPKDAFFQAWLFSLHPEADRIRGPEDLDIVLEFAGYSVPSFSALGAAGDPGVPVVWTGCAIVMIGLILAFYYHPREILVHLVRRDGGTEIRAGGSASRSREAFDGEFEDFISTLRGMP